MSTNPEDTVEIIGSAGNTAGDSGVWATIELGRASLTLTFDAGSRLSTEETKQSVADAVSLLHNAKMINDVLDALVAQTKERKA